MTNDDLIVDDGAKYRQTGSGVVAISKIEDDGTRFS
jgi:hypothetical protein